MTWRNTWLSGPGTAQWVIDDLELGPRPAMRWASGRYGCVTDHTPPDLLRRMDPSPPPHYPQRGQTSLFDREARNA